MASTVCVKCIFSDLGVEHSYRWCCKITESAVRTQALSATTRLESTDILVYTSFILLYSNSLKTGVPLVK